MDIRNDIKMFYCYLVVPFEGTERWRGVGGLRWLGVGGLLVPGNKCLNNRWQQGLHVPGSVP